MISATFSGQIGSVSLNDIHVHCSTSLYNKWFINPRCSNAKTLCIVFLLRYGILITELYSDGLSSTSRYRSAVVRCSQYSEHWKIHCDRLTNYYRVSDYISNSIYFDLGPLSFNYCRFGSVAVITPCSSAQRLSVDGAVSVISVSDRRPLLPFAIKLCVVFYSSTINVNS